MLDYATTMVLGQRQYQDVIDMLCTIGLPTEFTQTGGMNAALVVTLESGWSLLITDADDALSWSREEQRGWGVGLYTPDDADGSHECTAFLETEENGAQALLVLVEQLLAEERARSAARRDGSGA